jgi:5-methylcytosine-specific restriction endonuclease McrA
MGEGCLRGVRQNCRHRPQRYACSGLRSHGKSFVRFEDFVVEHLSPAAGRQNWQTPKNIANSLPKCNLPGSLQPDEEVELTRHTWQLREKPPLAGVLILRSVF